MKIESRVGKFVILILLVCSIVIGGNLLTSNPSEDGNLARFGDTLFLVKPAFAQSTYTTFPEDEVGISAYVNAEQDIDLGKVKEMLRGIEAEGDTYVIGIVELTGLPEEEFPHVYVSSDGWIVSYYSKYAPTSRIMQWYGYGGGKITTTTLEDAIAKICMNIGIDYLRVEGNIKYYHFKYSEATSLILAVDIDDMNLVYSIPSSVICYEGSWSTSAAKVRIDESDLVGGSLIEAGYFTGLRLTQDKVHTIDKYTSWTPPEGCPRGVAIVFVYR